jgi:hypothetical protein
MSEDDTAMLSGACADFIHTETTASSSVSSRKAKATNKKLLWSLSLFSQCLSWTIELFCRSVVLQKTKFRTGDAVYLLTGNGSTREGPYVVNDVLLSTKSYTLTLEDGRDVKDGAAIKEKYLQAA